MLISVLVAVLYIWGLLTPGWDILVLKLTAAVAVLAILGILGWIGYSLATVPPPEEIVPEISGEETSEESENPKRN